MLAELFAEVATRVAAVAWVEKVAVAMVPRLLLPSTSHATKRADASRIVLKEVSALRRYSERYSTRLFARGDAGRAAKGLE